EGDPAALARVRDHSPRALLAFQGRQRVRERAQVVPVATRHRPPERAELLLEIAEVAHLRDPRVRLHLVAVDDHGDLAELAVRGRLERLPELTLLELTVAGEHVDPTRAPEHAIGEHETACLRDAHAERP